MEQWDEMRETIQEWKREGESTSERQKSGMDRVK